ncbi:MAG: glucose-1-phosphate adenylyltransferase [Candidatus Lambdaproteobacteria bacterium RIFOXYD12_FULL_49_8]|uniref:Glucose-1-phosphate adenylyltransferase n=1 Tax=Candidatus Lambdaproteobacteria bacterium RIFOXYD2_FULL_50_16 TaxID=1817772 RepID=A0A1F6GG47_9PROT|nr:MAG: glucose-1-phosphate adenylyltransferase [Candidatus Lambdaproteobacteria bacterium RIFOXYD2_FULL_50_16]OGG98373.1 MAG: glucose-1-phosphate adenylyltransferase [Candidatus Lambdaproteobacteria bacterium RIFOXYD12_FULL_49_8]
MALTSENVLTFLLAGGKGTRLYPLTRDRSKPAVHFAARFRIIDWVLSSAINSGLRQIYVLTQFKSLSLEKHLRYGWNFLANELGEFVQAVPAQQRISEQWYSGTADAIFQNLHLLEDHRPDHVVILSGDHIYNMDFSEMFKRHIDTGADLTISAMEINKSEAHEFGVVTLNEQGMVDSFIEKPQDPALIKGEGDICYVNMGIYIFKTDTLVRELAKDAREATAHDFGKNIIPDMLNNSIVAGFDFKLSRFGTYWRDVGTIASYYEANMEFLNLKGVDDLIKPQWRIRTLGEQMPSAYFTDAEIHNSTVGSGSTVFRAKITNSLIGRNVHIGEGTVIEDSIVTSNCRVGKNCIIKKAILDDKVTLGDGIKVGVNPKEEAKFFFFSDGIAVLPKNFEL